MKFIAALSTVLLMGSAFAQSERTLSSSSGHSHMIEFNADTLLNGVISLGKSKTRGSSADNDLSANLRLNYAYALPTMPRLQLGGGLNYMSGPASGRGDAEDYGFNLAAYMNSSTDLANSFYGSIKWGIDWAHTYGGDNGNTKDEVGTLQLALGKRMSFAPWGIKHLTYTPEIAFVNQDSSTRSALEYNQAVEFRFLQFAVLF